MAKKKPSAKKHPGGRPIKLTPEVIEKLVGVFKDHFTIEEACL